MKIIVLKGRGECGKSETLGVHLRGMLTGNSYPQEEWWKVKDKRECLYFDGKVIDICPPGDTEEIVLENIAYFEKHPCDMAFTTTRTRGRGCKALYGYVKDKGAALVEVRKNYDDELDKTGQTEENRKLAEKLFKKI